MQVLFGLATACEVAYYSYIYASIDSKHYLKATSYTRGAVLAGRCLAYSFSQVFIQSVGFIRSSTVSLQLFISLNFASYSVLNYSTFGALVVTLVICIALPGVKKRLKLAVKGKNDPIHESSPASPADRKFSL